MQTYTPKKKIFQAAKKKEHVRGWDQQARLPPFSVKKSTLKFRRFSSIRVFVRPAPPSRSNENERTILGT